VTRPGTNGMHGSLFGFYSNDALQTRNPLLPANVGDPALHHWQFGATGGGALIPDKMFGFLSYQGTRDSGSSLQFATVPTAAMLTGNFSGLGETIFNPSTGTVAGTGRAPFTGSTILGPSINPISRAILASLPAANQPGFANNLISNVPYLTDANIGDAKVDYRFSDAFTGFLRYGITHIDTNQGSIFGAIGAPQDSSLQNHHASIALAGNMNGIIGELRFGYSRYRNNISVGPVSLPAGVPLTAFGGGVPSFSIAGLGTLGVPAGLPGRDIDNLYQGDANFHVYRGRNHVNFGLNIRSSQSFGFTEQLLGLYGANGAFSFGPGPTSIAGGAAGGPNALFARSIASFLLGAPTTAGVYTPFTTPSFQQMQYSLYLSDTLRVSSRFTVDLGVRYEIYGPVETRHSTDAFLFNPAGASLTRGSSYNNGDYDLNNVAPRAGISYKITEHTVFRGGYAMSYFPDPFLLSGLTPAGAGVVQGVGGSFGTTPFTVPAVPSNATGTPNVPLSTRTGFSTPYVHNYYAMLQQDLPHGFLFDAGYVGNMTRQFPFVRQINVALPGTGTAGLPFATTGLSAPVTEIGQGLNGNFNSLQINLTKRLSKGASFSVAYTFGKALDYGVVQLNNFNPAADYGPADWDRRHMLTISHVFALPVGRGSARWSQGAIGQILANWELVGLFRWATGTPYTVVADPTACACPGNTVIAANALAGASSVNGSAFFNRSLFSAPAPGTFGNIGRNSLRGPDLTNYNLSLFKSFAVRENFKLELRGEAYNIFNMTNFANPQSNFSLGSFGQSSSLLNGTTAGRLFMVGARVLF